MKECWLQALRTKGRSRANPPEMLRIDVARNLPKPMVRILGHDLNPRKLGSTAARSRGYVPGAEASVLSANICRQSLTPGQGRAEPSPSANLTNREETTELQVSDGSMFRGGFRLCERLYQIAARAAGSAADARRSSR